MIDTIAPQSRSWLTRISRLAAIIGIGAPIVALAMALMTGAGLLGWQVSLNALKPLSYIAMAAGVVAFVIMLLLALRRRWRHIALPFVTVVVAMAFVGMLSWNFGKAAIVPPIHDISTDLDQPPEFQRLTLRSDNLETVPPGTDPRMQALDPGLRWRLYHTEAYPDIQPITVQASVPETVEAARQLVADRGWELAVAEPATGRVEATATVSIYRFKDDVVLRIRPNADGPGSIVDMRSVSRVGVSDFGVNAERVRSFLADLKAKLGS